MRFFYTQQQMITKVILTHLFNNNTFDQLDTLYHVHDFANNLLTSLPEYFPMITNICIVEDTTEIREALKTGSMRPNGFIAIPPMKTAKVL